MAAPSAVTRVPGGLIGKVEITADDTSINSATLTLVPGLTMTKTVEAGEYEFKFQANYIKTAAAAGFAQAGLFIDGTQVAGFTGNGNGALNPCIILQSRTLTAGSHTFEIRAASAFSAGVVTVSAAATAPAQFSVKRV